MSKVAVLHAQINLFSHFVQSMLPFMGTLEQTTSLAVPPKVVMKALRACGTEVPVDTIGDSVHFVGAAWEIDGYSVEEGGRRARHVMCHHGAMRLHNHGLVGNQVLVFTWPGPPAEEFIRGFQENWTINYPVVIVAFDR